MHENTRNPRSLVETHTVDFINLHSITKIYRREKRNSRRDRATPVSLRSLTADLRRKFHECSYTLFYGFVFERIVSGVQHTLTGCQKNY